MAAEKITKLSNLSSNTSITPSIDDSLNRNPKRFSKKEKKELRKKYQRQLEEEMKRKEEQDKLSKKLYDEVPPTTFTRTISNPEAVMKKRREQRLENKLRDMGHGGSLKVFGGELNTNKPYVTLLVGINDKAFKVVRDTLDKYGLEKESADNYILVEITMPKTSALSRSLTDLREVDSAATERYLHDDERPLMSLLDENSNIIFAVRKKPKNLIKQSIPQTSFGVNNTVTQSHYSYPDTTSLSSSTGTNSMYQHISSTDYLIEPVLIQLDQNGREILDNVIVIKNGATEIGSDPRSSQSIYIRDPNVLSKHCVVTFVDGVVAITPFDGLLEVNGVKVETTQMLKDGFVIRIASNHTFRLRSNGYKQQQNNCNYANSPIMPKALNNMERPTNIPGLINKNNTTMPFITETTFGIVDGYVLRRTKSTDLPTEIVTESKAESFHDDFTPRKLDKMLHSRIPSTTHFPESSILNLPALIELYDHNVEDEFLKHLILDSTPDRYSFKLIPAFVIYMVARYRISAHLYRPGLSTEERKRHLQIFLDKIAERCYHVIHVNSSNKLILTFWLANLSELAKMLQSDQELSSMINQNIVNKFINTVEKSYELLVETSRVGLQSSMSSFLNVKLDNQTASRDILNQLDDLVNIIRKSRLNAALTIQIFSQLFYFINMYSFNWLVTTKEGSMYLSKLFGLNLRDRLLYINHWAEQQGLELAAECHLDRLQQTINLLTTPKTIDQIASLGATCYKLNSIQVRYLLENYVNEIGEPRASKELIDHVCNLSKGQADIMAQQDGYKVQLEENSQLQLPFVFPHDGYVVENFHGIPADMSDFIASLQTKGICRLMPQIGATGSWSVHMNNQTSLLRNNNNIIVNGNGIEHSSTGSNHSHQYPSSQASTYRPSNSPNIVNVMLKRQPGDSIGLSIVAAQGIGDSNFGIYVKKVVPNSAAYRDGKLEKGDQLLAVNGQSLVGITQEEAASRISQAGSEVHFEVSKRAAYYNGIIDSLEKSTTPSTPQIRQNGNNYHQPPPYHHQQQQSQQQYHHQQQQDSQLYKHVRSASASELFANQMDNISLASVQQSNTSMQYGNKLPAHYKPANRPTVVQPGRPQQSTIPSPGPYRKVTASPTPLYSSTQQRSASTVPFGSNQQQWSENYSNLSPINPQNHKQFASNTSSPLPPAPTKPQEAIYSQINHYPPAQVKPVPLPKPVSGRSSAPLFDHPARNYSDTKQMTIEELDAELDAIELKGDSMTPQDISRYHWLLGRIGELRGSNSLTQSKSTSDFPSLQNERHNRIEQHKILKPSQPLPFMSEMASRLEKKNQNGTGFSTSKMNNRSERAIDDVTEQFERINNIPLTPQNEYPPASTSNASTSSSTTMMPKPAMRDNSSSPEDKSKKRVQFKENIEENGYKNGHHQHQQQHASSLMNTKTINNNNDDVESAEPRVQIVGNHEVYINDPRQRRLNEIQQKSIKPSVDGSHLAFREKMKMFASQLGESTPKTKTKVSSAQREIENASDNI